MKCFLPPCFPLLQKQFYNFQSPDGSHCFVGHHVSKTALKAPSSDFTRSNFCKDHRDKIEVPDHLVVVDRISDKLNNRRELARLIKQYRHIFSIISEGTAFLLQGVT